MENHEVPFRNAKKDRDGYATILVKFGEFYVPVKGKPLPLIKEKAPDLDEIKRVNLTRWNLKDIPEISDLVGVLCGGGEGYTEMLYWNGNECVWKFWDEGLGGIDNDDDITLEKLDEKIEELEDSHSLYEPHEDRAGNMGDENVHCVYLGNSSVKLWDDGASELKKKRLINFLAGCGPSYLKGRSIFSVNSARAHHQKIPWAEIGEALRQAAADMTDERLGKLFLEGNV